MGVRRFLAVGCVVAVAVGAGACRQPPKNTAGTLQKVVSSLSKAQGVDESAVQRTLRQLGKTEDEQLRLAQSWQADLAPQPQPLPRLPDLVERYRPKVGQAGDALNAALCQAVFDTAATGRVPEPAEFVRSYLTGFAFVNVPYNVLLDVATDYQTLAHQARAGGGGHVNARFWLMKYQYCG